MANPSRSTQQFLWNEVLGEQIPEAISSLLQSPQTGYWDWDIATGTVITDETFCTSSGDEKSVKSLSFQDFTESIHPADREKFQHSIAEVKNNSQQRLDVEFRLKSADHSYKWIRSTGAVVNRDSQNNALRMIGLHEDIDQQKRVEIALQILNAFQSTGNPQEVLTDYCKAISDIFDSCYVAISHIIHKDGNDWAQVSGGWKNGEPLHQFEYPLKGTPCNHTANRGTWITKANVQNAFPDSTLLKQLEASSYAGIRLHDRLGYPVAILSMVNNNPFNETLDVLAILKLIGSRAEMELQRFELDEELRKARKIAEQATRTKTEFLANMSHEIRNPMTTILGYTELLGSDSEFGTDVIRSADAIESIKKSGQQLLSVINDVLDASKIDAGKMTVEPTPMAPIQMIEAVCSNLRAKAVERRIKFNIEYTSDIPQQIISDPHRLKQALQHLIDNAIKFTEQGSVTIAVSCHKSYDFNNMMIFDITDTGIGLTPEQKLEIESYQPFTQADGSSTRQHGGIGLGLRIAHSLATMLGGGIEIVSQKGKGSTFSLSVSAGSLEDVEMLDENQIANHIKQLNTTSCEPTEHEIAKPLLGKQILIAEDGKENQKLISYYLQKAGADVVIAENGKIALNKIAEFQEQSKTFDVTLMDMQMPELDGYSATRTLREQGYELPVIALTANALDDDRLKCIVAGCDDYISKPIDARKLINLCVQHSESNTELCLAD